MQGPSEIMSHEVLSLDVQVLALHPAPIYSEDVPSTLFAKDREPRAKAATNVNHAVCRYELHDERDDSLC